ncbi:cAMP-specific 3'-5'-cyclic phosphodiesterase 4B-like [Crotalus adamanteus]|uniref:cAMP-specific 3'-5'-cyclic phosphodiesterase 4B-like n=1 Tax=Crotalus adamanteus TaxID=8729 RepID=A0AAW1C0S7_CROAD
MMQLPILEGSFLANTFLMQKESAFLLLPFKPKDTLDPNGCSRSYTSSSMLGSDLRRGRRRLSSSLQVPPRKPIDRARSPEPDNVQRPTTLPLRIPPRISITHADPNREHTG